MKRKMDQDVNQLDFSHSNRCLNGVSRTCTNGLFFKKMVNGEVHRRSWIFYSESSGKMFCVYCVFFAGTQNGPFATCGFDDCSGERSFNALKRVKSFQRSTVTEKKLNRLAILYIENDILKQLDVDLIIDKFVAAKDRKRFV